MVYKFGFGTRPRFLTFNDSWTGVFFIVELMLMQQIEKRLEIDWLVVGIITVVEWRKHLQLDSLIIYDILLMNKKKSLGKMTF